MTDAHPIATITKNSREEIHVALTKFKNHQLVDIRVFADNGSEHVATKKGISIAVQRLPELIQALQGAEAEARRCGLLDGEGGGP